MSEAPKETITVNVVHGAIDVSPIVMKVFRRLRAERDEYKRRAEVAMQIAEVVEGQNAVLRETLWALEQAYGPDHVLVDMVRRAVR